MHNNSVDMYLLITEEGSKFKVKFNRVNYYKSNPLFWPGFSINSKSSNWCPRNIIFNSGYSRGYLLQGDP